MSYLVDDQDSKKIKKSLQYSIHGVLSACAFLIKHWDGIQGTHFNFIMLKRQ